MRYLIIIIMFVLSCSLVSAVLVDNSVIGTLNTDNEVRVIVTYNHDMRLPEGATEIPGFNGFYGTLSKNEILDLANDPNINTIQIDWKLQVLREDGYDIINADIINNISIGDVYINGTGQTICVIDTGLDYTHEEFGSCNTTQFLAGNCSMVPYGYDYVNNDNDPFDDEGHGTHVSGIAHITAPGARLIPMKVCDASGDCYVSDMVTAVSWCSAFRSVYNITSISISIGDKQSWSDSNCFPSDPLSQMINNAKNNGLFVAVASGNEGYSTGINYPACAGGAVSIGATTDLDIMATYTNTASNLDIVAPGNLINSTIPGGYDIKSGTSMSTPFASASSVLIRQYFKEQDNITLTASEIEILLKNSGVLVESWPRIDLASSINSGYECYQESECGTDSWVEDPVCIDSNVWQNYTSYSCDTGYCNSNTSLVAKETCTNGCSEGSCIVVVRSGGGGGWPTSNLYAVYIESNSDWNKGDEVEIIIKAVDKYNSTLDVDSVEAELVNKLTSERIELSDIEKISDGVYKITYTPNLEVGDYTLEVTAMKGIKNLNSSKDIKIVKLSKVLSLQSIGFQSEDIQKTNIFSSLITWLRSLNWDNFP